MPRSLIGKSGVLIPLCLKGHLGSTPVWAKLPAAAHNPLAYGAAKKRRPYYQLLSKMEKFVAVNGRILDFDKYRSDFFLMQKIITLDMKEYFIKLGFKQRKAAEKKRFRTKINFCNDELDFEITLAINKKQRLQFI